MKRLSLKSLSMILSIILTMPFVACSNDDDPLYEVSIQLKSKKEFSDYSQFIVTLIEKRSGEKYQSVASKDGLAKFEVPVGSFDITAEDNFAGSVSTYYGSKLNCQLGGDKLSLQLELEPVQSLLEQTFVLDELFFNGSSNGDYDYNYYEKYFTITNISNRPLYADGLSFAICGDFNSYEDTGDKSKYLPEKIIVKDIYTIPGNGRQYLVESGNSLVIAHSAIDHTEGGKKPNARNLSGADFEIFVPHEYAMTTDNPDVDNLIVNYSMSQAFDWSQTGHAPLMILRHPEEINLQEYIEENKLKMDVTGGFGSMQLDYIVIPSTWVVDAAETGFTDNLIHKVLPNSIDRGSILIECENQYSGFTSQFVKRKGSGTNLVDTDRKSVV